MGFSARQRCHHHLEKQKHKSTKAEDPVGSKTTPAKVNNNNQRPKKNESEYRENMHN